MNTVQCPYEVPPFDDDNLNHGVKIGDEFPPRDYTHLYTWWSWHPRYPYWSKSVWGGNTIEEAVEKLESKFASSMKVYANVLVHDDLKTRELTVVRELPCQDLDVWNKIKTQDG